jgi:hypothetical protein
MRTFEDMILDFVDVLGKMRVDYVIIGGVAVSSWGTPRTTGDLDVIAVIKMENIKKLCENLQNKGFSIDEEDIKSALEEKTHFTVFDQDSEYHVDVKGIYDKFDALTIKNRIAIDYCDHIMNMASAEDTLAHKLLFGGHQDMRDAESILLRQSVIDMEYLEALCKELGILAELQAMKEKIGSI